MLSDAQRTHFELFGFIVLRGLLDESEVGQLSAEVDTSLQAVFADAYASNTRQEVVAPDDVAAEGNFLPLMADRVPLSQSLPVDDPRLREIAEALLGDFTIASPALATCLVSDTPWHNDGGLGSRWLRCNAYLQPTTRQTGALRVVPGSQDQDVAQRIDEFLRRSDARSDDEALPGVALETIPGDVIVFDPRVHHGSWGGSSRLRWSVDYLAMPSVDDVFAMTQTASLIRTLSGWPTNEDFPTWSQWQASPSDRRREAVAKLRTLGVSLSS